MNNSNILSPPLCTDRIAIAVQPMINPKTNSIEAGEVLVRWIGSDGSVKTPINKNDVDWNQVDLDIIRIVYVNSCFYKNRYKRLFINVSESTLSCDGSYPVWFSTVKKITTHDIDIIIEITELINDSTLRHRYDDFKKNNIKIALDDYGTDNSDLNRLVSFQWDYVKFEATQNNPMTNFKGIQYCKKNGISMVSEKVEVGASVWLAKKLGIELVQGYVTGKPEMINDYMGAYAVTGVNQ